VLHSCIVRRDALVGMNAVVMDGAEVGPESVVAAGAIVPAGRKLPARSLVVGAPAKVLRTLSDDDVARKREGTATYHQLTERCLASLREVAPQTHVAPDRRRLELPGLRPLTQRPSP
jgi:phenylacetic acid degradation protein